LHPDNQEALRQRVHRAAEATLTHHQYVSPIDVLTGMGLLQPVHVQSWRKGRVDYLERMIQGNLKKIALAMSMFRAWAAEKGLRSSDTRYVRSGRSGTEDLRFSVSGDPGIERNYRTHYISPALTERNREKIQEKLSKAAEPVVFQNLRDSQFSECGAEIHGNSLLLMDKDQPLCMPCAGLADLDFLPAGDPCLTRRAAKYSERSRVVVRFSRSRGRYERQGILVEPAAVERAEEECTEDADERAAARARGAAQRRKEDRELTVAMAQRIASLYPGIPADEAAAIAEHTAARGSGRVGRTASGRSLEEEALSMAVAAAVRHRHTGYDKLLAGGMDRAEARQRVLGRVREILAGWRSGVGDTSHQSPN
jgi:hypothetical protein